MTTGLTLIGVAALLGASPGFQAKPHIVIIMADDMGIGDVSFRGSDNILTPNIDALAYNGVILDRYYVPNLCTPSRATLFTGKYPFHTGTQHSIILNFEPWGLPLNHTLLPEVLRANGYSTNLIGKWHLGFSRKAYTPMQRGFDYHFGYYGGYIDYFDHSCYLQNSTRGYDMRREYEPDFSGYGTYATDLFTDEAVRVIREHPQSTKPLFLVLSHLAPHRANSDRPFQAPEEVVEQFEYIRDAERRGYAAMLSKLDTSVGRVIRALSNSKMLNNSIVLFYSDNGAPVLGPTRNAGSNFPLRGQKYSPFEGGIRSPGILYSPLLKYQQTISKQVLYVGDWFPTLARAAGIELDPQLLHQLDGLDMWDALVNHDAPTEREIVHNINEVSAYSMYMQGDFKVVNGTTIHGVYDRWLSADAPKEDDPRAANYEQVVLDSITGRVLANPKLTAQKIKLMRKSAVITCPDLQPNRTSFACHPLVKPCLFNLLLDPCEKYNIAEDAPEKLTEMLAVIKRYQKTAVRAAKVDFYDARSEPTLHNFTWSWWEDIDEQDSPNVLFSPFWFTI